MRERQNALLENDEDREKFRELHLKYRDKMFHVAKGILHEDSLAEDAVQDAFFRVVKTYPKLLRMSDKGARLYLIIAVRHSAIRIRDKNKHEVAVEEVYDVSPEMVNVEREVESRDEGERMMECIRSLDPKYADVLILQYYYDMSAEEIARVLGITSDNVRTRAHRAREMLKKKIIEEGWYDGA